MILEAIEGPAKGRQFHLRVGRVYQVGRMEQAEIVMAEDQAISWRHLELEFDGQTCFLRDLGSTNGTRVNDKKVTEAVLHDGDRLRAGDTVFLVRIETAEPVETREPVILATGPSAGALGGGAPAAGGQTMRLAFQVVQSAERVSVRQGSKEPLLQFLCEQAAPLYAVLDAARDDRILSFILSSSEQFQSLYEGEEGHELAFVAPYLVRLPPDSLLLEVLLRDGWGESWGVYLTCDEPFLAVRRHLRHFLLVKLDDGREVYFRFYDPRVLRVFLPTCTNGEAAEFFGPLESYLMETEDPEVLVRFAQQAGPPVPELVAVVPERSEQRSVAAIAT